MLPDFLPAAEVLAKGVKHVACYVADAISERRNAFNEDEAGDYLACAGADALAESLGRMECDGPDASEASYCGAMTSHAAGRISCLMPVGHSGDHRCYSVTWPNVLDGYIPSPAVTPPTADEYPAGGEQQRPPSSSATRPPGHSIPIKRDPMYLALRLAEVAEGVPLTTLLTVAHVLINKGAQAVIAPQRVETGHDMAGRWAAETFPQHTKPPK